MEKCLIEKTKRQRVHGSGPSRKELIPFLRVGSLPEHLVKSLLDISTSHTENDLGTDQYSISKHCNFEKVFNAAINYRQILLQKKPSEDASQVNEYAYTQWGDIVHDEVKDYIQSIFGPVYRFRISVMEPNHELNWHIDTDTSVICRAQICLNDNNSSFEFDVKGERSGYRAMPGDIHFVNTGWKHRVVNGDTPRVVAIFGFDFSTINKDLKDLIHV